jgi:hypothetical protein
MQVPREPLIKVYFRHCCVGSHFRNLADLKRIRDFLKYSPPCPDENILLIRGSLGNAQLLLRKIFDELVVGLTVCRTLQAGHDQDPFRDLVRSQVFTGKLF